MRCGCGFQSCIHDILDVQLTLCKINRNNQKADDVGGSELGIFVCRISRDLHNKDSKCSYRCATSPTTKTMHSSTRPTLTASAAAPSQAPHIPSLDAAYIVGDEIGKGSCSVSIREAVDRDSGETVVVKFISLLDPNFNPEECEILGACRHENIVRSFGAYYSSTHVALVMEDLRRGGELFARISHRSSPLPESAVAWYMRGLLRALRYAHETLGIVHRDVKLENIMLLDADGTSAASRSSGGGLPSDSMPQVKLIDFGFSKRIGRGSKSLNSCCGSPNYMSPEMLRATRTQEQSASALPTRHQPYGNEVDMWAAGVAMYVLLVGSYPFYHEKRSAWHKAILVGQYTLPSTLIISEQARDLLSKLLTVRADDRLSASAALRHSWFRCIAEDDDEEFDAAAHRSPVTSDFNTPAKRKTPPIPQAAPAAASAANNNNSLFTPPHNHHTLTFEASPFQKKDTPSPLRAEFADMAVL